LAVGTLQTSPANACAGKGYAMAAEPASRMVVCRSSDVELPLDFYIEGAEKGRRKWLIDGCTG